MSENRKSWNIPVGKSDLITVFSGTNQILNYKPNSNARIIVGVEITETVEDK